MNDNTRGMYFMHKQVLHEDFGLTYEVVERLEDKYDIILETKDFRNPHGFYRYTLSSQFREVISMRTYLEYVGNHELFSDQVGVRKDEGYDLPFLISQDRGDQRILRTFTFKEK